jgi:hypothetical protein
MIGTLIHLMDGTLMVPSFLLARRGVAAVIFAYGDRRHGRRRSGGSGSMTMMIQR